MHRDRKTEERKLTSLVIDTPLLPCLFFVSRTFLKPILHYYLWNSNKSLTSSY